LIEQAAIFVLLLADIDEDLVTRIVFARLLERLGWRVYITDSAGRQFGPSDFHKLLLMIEKLRKGLSSRSRAKKRHSQSACPNLERRLFSIGRASQIPAKGAPTMSEAPGWNELTRFQQRALIKLFGGGSLRNDDPAVAAELRARGLVDENKCARDAWTACFDPCDTPPAS
jgi:hypothetical protein